MFYSMYRWSDGRDDAMQMWARVGVKTRFGLCVFPTWFIGTGGRWDDDSALTRPPPHHVQ